MAEEKKETKEQPSQSSGLGEVVVTTSLILLLLGVVILLYFGALRFRAEMYHNQAASVLNESNDIQRAQELEIKAKNLASFEDKHHRVLSRIYLNQLNDVINDGQLNQAQRQQKFTNLMNATVRQAREATKISDHNVSNWSNQGLVYRSLMSYAVQDADKWAVDSYQRAIDLSPTSPDLYLQLAQAYLVKADNAQGEDAKQVKQESLASAEENLNKALELKRNYWPAYTQLAAVYGRRGDFKQAAKNLKVVSQARPKDQSIRYQLGVLYYKNKDYEKAEVVLKEALKLDDSYANARYFLGLSYDRQNKKGEALKQFEKIASLGEKNKQRVQTIIDNLKAGKPALGGQTEELPELEATTTEAVPTE